MSRRTLRGSTATTGQVPSSEKREVPLTRLKSAPPAHQDEPSLTGSRVKALGDCVLCPSERRQSVSCSGGPGREPKTSLWWKEFLCKEIPEKASRSVDRGDRAGHGSEEEGSMKRSLMGVVGAKSRWGPHTGIYISGSGPPQEGGRGGVFPPSPSNGWLKLLPEYKLPSASSLPQSKGQLEYGEWAGHGQPLNTWGKRDVTCVSLSASPTVFSSSPQ